MVIRRIFKEIEQKFKQKKGQVSIDMPDTQGEPSGVNSDKNNNSSSKGVRIIRSDKRKRTISARLVEGVMTVHAPLGIPDSELEKVIDKFKKRLYKRNLRTEFNKTQNLAEVAKKLNREYFNNSLKITSVTYAANQDRIFGSCNYRAKKIRISHRLAGMPHWVRDYVIIHEMAHLIEPNHGKTFSGIVSRYRLTERARGYLMAKGFDSEEPYDIEQG